LGTIIIVNNGVSRMIDPKLETLIKVCEVGSFTRAAEALSLTQPAVSQHIKQLEKNLDIKIFNRSEGELKLTQEGEIVIKYAKRIKSLYNNMYRNLRDEKRQMTRLSVGVTHTGESNLLTEVLAKYCNEKAGLHLTIVTDTINNLYNKLRIYEIDLAVVEGRILDNSFNSILLDTDCLMLAVSNDNPLAQKSMVTLNELKKEKLILRLPNSGTRNLFISHLESNNVSIDEFNIILEVDNIATIKDLVRRNLGVSILAKSACLDELRKGKLALLPVENLSMIREINIVYHKDFEQIEMLSEITKIYNESSKIYKAV